MVNSNVPYRETKNFDLIAGSTSEVCPKSRGRSALQSMYELI
jgi:hypothetical protein